MADLRVHVGRAALGLAILSFGLPGSGCAVSPDDDARGLGDNVNQAGLTLALCGTVDDFVAPHPPTKDGELAMEGRRWVVLSNAVVVDKELLSPGDDVCVNATMDTSGRIETCAASAKADQAAPDN